MSEFEARLRNLGILPVVSSPGHPETCGKKERVGVQRAQAPRDVPTQNNTTQAAPKPPESEWLEGNLRGAPRKR